MPCGRTLWRSRYKFAWTNAAEAHHVLFAKPRSCTFAKPHKRFIVRNTCLRRARIVERMALMRSQCAVRFNRRLMRHVSANCFPQRFVVGRPVRLAAVEGRLLAMQQLVELRDAPQPHRWSSA